MMRDWALARFLEGHIQFGVWMAKEGKGAPPSKLLPVLQVCSKRRLQTLLNAIVASKYWWLNTEYAGNTADVTGDGGDKE